MKVWKHRLAAAPVVGRPALFLYRFGYSLSYYVEPLRDLFWWLLKSNETTNFTYDLDETNERYLGCLLSDITGLPYEKVMGYVDEIKKDTALRDHIRAAIAASELGFLADSQVKYGRRVGWYAFVRALKPKVVVETGVDKGMGSCVITAALAKNAEEGSAGSYCGTDINPKAGYLLSGKYAQFGRILYGDSIESIKAFKEPIDLFINDSDHSAEYEAEEYRAVLSKLSPQAVILGDNSHCTDKLFAFSIAHQRKFAYFQEKPKQHWYPGGGIGVSYVEVRR